MEAETASDPLRVVFVELTHGGGGSSVSLAQLLRALDPARIAPQIVLREGNRRADELRALAPIHALSGPRRSSATGRPPTGPSGIRGLLQRTDWYARLSARRRFAENVLEPGNRLAGILSSLEPDVVYVNNGLVHGAPAVVAAHELGVRCLVHERGFARIHAPYRTLAKSVDGFISISHAVAAHLEHQLGPLTDSHVVHNGIDLDEYEAAEPGERAPGGFRVISVGRLERWKGVDVLLEAVARTADRIPGLEVWILGEGPERDALEKRTGFLGIADRVSFLGFVPDVRGPIRESDVLVHTAIEPEPFGRVVLEGLALGTPVIATALGGVPEIIADRETGLLVPPGNPEALADRLLRLAADGALARNLASAGRTHVEQHFSHRRTAERIQHILTREGEPGWV